MKRVVLLSCSKKKLPYKAPAEKLYNSSLFRKLLACAKKLSPDAIFILSAKYGLLRLDEEIEPYDLTLDKMSKDEVRRWADKVIEQLSQEVEINKTHFIILAGKKYYEPLIGKLKSYEIPFKGLRIGELHHAVNKKLKEGCKN